MQKPAKIKLRLMVRKATFPIASMLSLALKIERSCVGNSWKTKNPSNI